MPAWQLHGFDNFSSKNTMIVINEAVLALIDWNQWNQKEDKKEEFRSYNYINDWCIHAGTRCALTGQQPWSMTSTEQQMNGFAIQAE